MKIIKPIILMFVITLSFLLGVGEIKALPQCDFKNNYGTISTDQKERVQVGDANHGMTRVSYFCFNSNGNPLGAAFKDSCSNPSGRFYIQFNVSYITSTKGGYVKTAKFTIYNNDDQAQCYIEPEMSGEAGVYQFNFNLNKKEVKKIVAEGTYFDGEEVKSFETDTFNINHEGDGSGSVHTTIPNTTPTTLIAGILGDEDAIESEVVKKTSTSSSGGATDVKAACTSITALFDEYWPIVMVITPILLIVMITIDFFKAMASGDADALRKSGTNTAKRTIAAVILLALPNLVIIIFDLFGIEICL